MIKLVFKDVGQGDSIILEWTNGLEKHFGIIDCTLKAQNNPILDEIKLKGIKYIDFIILTHLHVDHFSGMPELLEYCLSNEVKIGDFYHTFETQYLHLFSYIFASQRDQKLAQRLLQLIRDLNKASVLRDVVSTSSRTKHHNLDSKIEIQFLSPTSNDHVIFTEHQAKYLKGKISTLPDMNSLSIVSKITNSSETALLTADTTIKQLKRLIGGISEIATCIQVPHHGSHHNHLPDFWNNLNKKKNCPAVFSVGDVRRDKLPKKDVVEFFDTTGYFVESTNFVYGISDHFGGGSQVSPQTIQITNALSSFSTLKKSTLVNSIPPKRFIGDKIYNIL